MTSPMDYRIPPSWSASAQMQVAPISPCAWSSSVRPRLATVRPGSQRRSPARSLIWPTLVIIIREIITAIISRKDFSGLIAARHDPGNLLKGLRPVRHMCCVGVGATGVKCVRPHRGDLGAGHADRAGPDGACSVALGHGHDSGPDRPRSPQRSLVWRAVSRALSGPPVRPAGASADHRGSIRQRRHVVAGATL